MSGREEHLDRAHQVSIVSANVVSSGMSALAYQR
jgi:hypothetical protein